MKLLLTLALALAGTAGLAQRPQFRTGIDVVQLNVAVTDKTKVIADLIAADFEVRDNDVVQEVTNVSREALPIDVTMVIDTSESVAGWVQTAIVNAANKVRMRLQPSDRLSLLTFNQRVVERASMRPATDVNVLELGKPAGQTSLHDALATVLVQRAVADRRQLAIVFSDGRDSTSLLSDGDVLDLARRSQTATFFVVDLQSGSRMVVNWVSGPSGVPTPSMSLVKENDPRLMTFVQTISAATGGVVQLASLNNITIINGRTREVVQRPRTEMLDEPFLKALEDFRTSYVVSYVLAGVPRPGWHEVKVRVKRPGTSYQIRTRNGYTGG
ncbi:MAG TPA: VWA domain-containing protein [Vicinamibacterales bacterium]|nr:VWA domain-containing protein [Vicinamibacterales bacterium]